MALETITAEELVNTPLSSPGWVVEDLIGVGVTLLVGAPKVGKSWLVLRLAECVSRGEPLWGFATCGGAVLDLALEDNLPRIQQRLFRLADECSETFHLCVSAPSLADGLLDEIAAFVVAHPGTKLVIVDTLQTVRQSSKKSAYASDYHDVRAFKGLADHFGIAVVLVHHQRKMDDPDPLNTVSGTNGITGAADTTMVLDRKRGEKRAFLKVTGRDVIERVLALEFNDCRWELSEDQSVEHEEERPVPHEVLEVIRFMEGRLGWAGTATELVAQTGLGDARAATLGRKLAEHSQALLETGIRYSTQRTASARTIFLERVAEGQFDDGSDSGDGTFL